MHFRWRAHRSEALPEAAGNGYVDIEKVGVPRRAPVHRGTIAADYKRIAVLAGGGARGGADSRGVAGGGWLTAE